MAGKYEKDKTIIIDSPVYFGNSGGPVFLTSTQYFELIGIVSQYIPYEDIMESKETGAVDIRYMNSGYAIITPIEYAIRLMSDFK